MRGSSSETSGVHNETEVTKNPQTGAAPGNESSVVDSQIVLILVGLVGSGKSTFAQALQKHLPHFRRCNQDELGDRRKVEDLARASFRQGLSVCIDRSNFDIQQRSTWITIAHEVSGAEAWVLTFDTPVEICEQRLLTRTGHPTITSPEQGLSVLQRFVSLYRTPAPHEGYDRELRLPVDEQRLSYSLEDIAEILLRLQTSPKIDSSQSFTSRGREYNSQYSSRGQYNSRRGYGYGGGGGYRGSYGAGNVRAYRRGGPAQYAHRGSSYWRGPGNAGMRGRDFGDNAGNSGNVTRGSDALRWRVSEPEVKPQ